MKKTKEYQSPSPFKHQESSQYLPTPEKAANKKNKNSQVKFADNLKSGFKLDASQTSEYKSKVEIPNSLKSVILEMSEPRNICKNLYNDPELYNLEEELKSIYPYEIESPLIKGKKRKISHNIFLKKFDYRGKDENYFCCEILNVFPFFRKSYNDMRIDSEKIGVHIKKYSEFLIECCKYVKLQKYSAGDYIYKINDIGGKMYGIIEGEVQLFMPKSEKEVQKDVERLEKIKLDELEIPSSEHMIEYLDFNNGKRTNNKLKDTDILEKDELLRAIIGNRQEFPWISDNDLQQIGMNDLNEYYKDGIFQYKSVAKLSKNQIFGELAQLKKCARNVTAVASTYIEVLTLNTEDFDKIFKQTLEQEGVKGDFFNELFGSNISRNKLFDVQHLFTEKIYSRDSYIFNEGDHLDNIYIIKEGDVQLNGNVKNNKKVRFVSQNLTLKKDVQPKSPQKNLLAVIGRRNFLGEDDYLCNLKFRTYSAKALSTPTTVYYIPINTFVKHDKLFGFIIEKMQAVAKSKNTFMIRKNKISTNIIEKITQHVEDIKQMDEKTNTFIDSYAFCKNINIDVKNKLKQMMQADEAYHKNRFNKDIVYNPYWQYQNNKANDGPTNFFDIGICDKDPYANKKPTLRFQNSKKDVAHSCAKSDRPHAKSTMSLDKLSNRSNSKSKYDSASYKDFAKNIILTQKEHMRQQNKTAKQLSYNTMNKFKYSEKISSERNSYKENIKMNSVNSVTYCPSNFQNVFKKLDVKSDIMSKDNMSERKKNFNDMASSGAFSTDFMPNIASKGKTTELFNTPTYRHTRVGSDNIQSISHFKNQNIISSNNVYKEKEFKKSSSNEYKPNYSSFCTKNSDWLVTNAKVSCKNSPSCTNNFKFVVSNDAHKQSVADLGFKDNQRDDIQIKNSHNDKTMKSDTFRYYKSPINFNARKRKISTDQDFYKSNTNEKITNQHETLSPTSSNDQSFAKNPVDIDPNKTGLYKNDITKSLEDIKVNSKILGNLTSNLNKEVKSRLTDKYNNIIKQMHSTRFQNKDSIIPSSNVFRINETKETIKPIKVSHKKNDSVELIHMKQMNKDLQNVGNFKISLNKTYNFDSNNQKKKGFANIKNDKFENGVHLENKGSIIKLVNKLKK